MGLLACKLQLCKYVNARMEYRQVLDVSEVRSVRLYTTLCFFSSRTARRVNSGNFVLQEKLSPITQVPRLCYVHGQLKLNVIASHMLKDKMVA